MIGRFVTTVLFAVAILALPLVGYAQEAVLTGTVSDSTGGVLPGVTVVAVLEATGNRFEAVTDEAGIYRIPVRVGVYTVTAELQGFASQSRTGLQLLVGQTATINLQMGPSTVQETVTVTAEAPLLNVSTSALGGNVDPQQVQELPMNGGNWMALVLLAPGSRTSSTNAASPLPDRNGGEVREYQTNLDGMQVTNSLGGGGQPAFSQQMIAEFQFISNRFDATQGRSQGVQVNVITKSGTNRLAGGFRTNFRDDRFNAENPALGRKVPITNQQFGGSIGGPIVRDRLHYFGFYEYEREPRSSIWNTPYPRFNVELNGKVTKKLWGTRLDYQLSPQNRVMLKGNLTRTFEPFGPGSNNNHPASTQSTAETQNTMQAQLTQVLSNRALNEVRVAWAGYIFTNENPTHWSNHWMANGGPYGPVTSGSPRIQFTGFNITGNNGYPRHRSQDLYSVQDSFTLSYNAKGRHDLKAGGEFLLHHEMSANCTNCMGNIDARNGAISTLRPGIEDIFPDPFNVDLWNLAAISPLVRTYRLGVHKGRRDDVDLPYYAAYVQDDWKMTDKLTLNLGVRYDLTIDSFAQYGEFEPFMDQGSAAGCEQRPAAARLRLPAERSDGDARRRGQVLRRSDHAGRALRAGARDDCGARGGQRRPAGLRGQPVQRPGAVVRGSRDAVLLGAAAGGELRGLAGAQLHGRGPVCAARVWRDGAAGRLRARAADVAGHDRRAAADRHHDVGGSRLRLQPRPRREVHSGEREPELRRSGRHRHQQSVHEPRAAAVPAVRHRRDDAVHRPPPPTTRCRRRSPSA